MNFKKELLKRYAYNLEEFSCISRHFRYIGLESSNVRGPLLMSPHEKYAQQPYPLFIIGDYTTITDEVKSREKLEIVMKKTFFILVTVIAVSICSYGQELRPVKGPSNKWGFVDGTSKEVIPFEYTAAQEFSEGLAAVKKYSGWGFIDTTGYVVIRYKYQNVGKFSEGMVRVSSDHFDNYGFTSYGKWRFIDKTGLIVIPEMYDDAGDFSEGLARVKSKKKWGFINNTGTPVISFIYDDASDFSDGLAQVRIKRNWGFIDKKGTEIVRTVPLETATERNTSQTSTTSSERQTPTNSSVFNRPGQVSIGFSPAIYLEKGLFMFGLCGKMRVGIAKPIRLEGAFTYNFSKTIKLYGINVKTSMWDVSLNMQTIVTKGDIFLLYPLIGLRVSGLKVSAFGESASNTFFGMNFGAGFDVKISKVVFFNFEPKYMLSFVDGTVGSGFTVSAGLIFRFK